MATPTPREKRSPAHPPPQRTSSMSLLQTPNELLLLVAEALGTEFPADLNALCQTSRRLASLLTPLLYRLVAEPRYGVVALHWGAATGDEPLVRAVMERGEGIVVECLDARAAPTALYKTSQGRDDDAVGRVMARGARIIVYAEGGDRETSLHWAVVRRLDALLRTLLQKGAPADVYDCSRATALHYAAEFWDLAPVELLVAGGADVGARLSGLAEDAPGHTALHRAVAKDSREVAKRLLGAGADIDAQDDDGSTPLHVATTVRNAAAVRLLLKNGAAVDVNDADFNTPLDLAWSPERRAILLLLLARAGPLVRIRNGHTPLHFASENGHRPLVRRLLANGFDLEARNAAGQTALHLAVLSRNYETAKLLMREGADVDVVDPASQCSLLELARKNGQSGRHMVQFILGFGADEDRDLEDLIEGHHRR